MDETDDSNSCYGDAPVEPGAVVFGCFFLGLAGSAAAAAAAAAEHAAEEVGGKGNGAGGGDGKEDELHGEDAGC